MNDDGDVGVVDVDLLLGESLAERGADELVHLERVALVGRRAAARVDLEAVEVPGLSHRPDGGRRELVLIEAALVRKRDARHAGHAPDGRRHGLGGLAVGGLDDDVTGNALDVPHVEVLEGPVQVRDQLVLERRAVLPLESDLVVVDEAESLGHG